MHSNLSILIPFFNHNRYIENLIIDILEQDECIMEIIIINDGSIEDPTELINKAICNQKGGRKVKYYSQANMGLPATLNRLIDISQGDIIAVIASDDLLMPQSLRERVKILQENENVDAILGDALVIDENGHVLSKSAMTDMFKVDTQVMMVDQECVKKELVYHWGVPGPCLMIRRSVYDDIGKYDETLRVEDRDFYLKLFAKKNVHFMNKPIAQYRVHGANTAHKKNSIWIYKDISLSNYRNARSYFGAERLYLSSYWLDNNIYGLLQQKRITETMAILLRLPAIGLRVVLRLAWDVRVYFKKRCLKESCRGT